MLCAVIAVGLGCAPPDDSGPHLSSARRAAATVLYAEDFETGDGAWTSVFDAPFGTPATWSAVDGGSPGLCLGATRGSAGSSARVKVLSVSANRNLQLSASLRCPTVGSPYWMEFAYRPGNNDAADFDGNVGAWTMVKKFTDTGPNGNGGTWATYQAVVFTGATSQLSLGIKYGSQGPTPLVAWDTLRLVEPDIQQVVVSPSSTSLAVGQTLTFGAQAQETGGAPVQNIVFSWTANASAGTVTGAGAFTAGCTNGAFTGAVSATANGKTGSADITITSPGPISKVVVTPASASVPAGGTQSFGASATDACNAPLAGTPTWSATRGAVSSAGVYTAPCAAGADTVTATISGVSQGSSVTVVPGPLATLAIVPANPSVPAGSSLQLTAIGKDSCQNPLSSVTATWSAADGGTVDGTGLFTAGTTPGTYPDAVTATSGALSAKATITVVPGAVDVVSVSPTQVTLTPGGVQQFTVEAKDAYGNVVQGTPQWSIINGGGAITQAGAFTADNTAGTFNGTVRVQIAQSIANATVVIQPGPPTTLTVKPDKLFARPGEQWTFGVEGADVFGNSFKPVVVTWSLSPAVVGTLSGDGVLVAGSVPGEYPDAVTASAEGLTARATVVVLDSNAPLDGGDGTSQFHARSGCGCQPVPALWELGVLAAALVLRRRYF